MPDELSIDGELLARALAILAIPCAEPSQAQGGLQELGSAPMAPRSRDWLLIRTDKPPMGEVQAGRGKC